MTTKKVRPVLIPQDKAIWPNCLWIGRISKELNLDTSYNDNPCTLNPIDDSMLPQQLILISLEDDEIEIDDNVCSLSLNRVFCNNDGSIEIDEDIKKVIATQSQLSPELIQQLVDEYNNGGMKDFEIEIINNYHNVNRLSNFEEPKLTSGFVTVAKKPILYTEEEVYQLLIESHLALNDNKLIAFSCAKWFEQNKKNL